MTRRGRVTPPAERADGIIVGTWLSLGSPAAAEVIGHAGFDWILIDQQHSPVGPAEMVDLIRAVSSSGAAPIVRIPANTPHYFGYALDAGAHGVMVPMVEDLAAAQSAVRSFAYPPAGARSIGGYRAHLAFGMNRADYFANPPARLIIQLEHWRAVEHVDAIASVSGIDVLFLGPQDLSASYGLAPSLETVEPAMASAIEALQRAARIYDVELGALCRDVDSARRYAAAGFTWLAVGTDAAMLTGVAQATVTSLKPARAAPDGAF